MMLRTCRRLSIGRSLGALVALYAMASGAWMVRAEAPVPNPTVEVTVENRGKFAIELYPRDAPKTVKHFVDLVKRKFYDGVLFHRIVPGFVAQAGDPASTKLTAKEIADRDDHAGGTTGLGNGGSGANGASAAIPFEQNDHTHEMGTVAIALSGPRSPTGDSQFFINLKANHTLDGDYCVFGQVVKGMEVVRKLRRGDRILTAVAVNPKTAKH